MIIKSQAALLSAALASFSSFASAGPGPLGQLMSEPPAAVSQPRPQPPARVYGSDATAEYEAIFKSAEVKLNAVTEKKLTAYKFLLVPGLFACMDKSGLPLAGRKPSAGPKPHFAEQAAWLKSIGAEYEILKLRTESSVRDNVPIIAAAVRSSGKPVMIIAESKGGLDVLEALLRDAGLLPKVKGVVMSQIPFHGTPVADIIVDHPGLRKVVAKVMRRVNGSIDSLVELGTADRKAYMEEHAARIAEITRLVPILSVATWKEPCDKETDTALRPLRDLMLRQGLKNDGLVAIDSAILAGTDFVKISGPDHGAPIKKTKKIDFDRARFARAVLTMLLERQEQP